MCKHVVELFLPRGTPVPTMSEAARMGKEVRGRCPVAAHGSPSPLGGWDVTCGQEGGSFRPCVEPCGDDDGDNDDDGEDLQTEEEDFQHPCRRGSWATPGVKRTGHHPLQRSFQCNVNSSFTTWLLQLAGAPWGRRVWMELKRDILLSPPSPFPRQAEGRGEALSLLIWFALRPPAPGELRPGPFPAGVGRLTMDLRNARGLSCLLTLIL